MVTASATGSTSAATPTATAARATRSTSGRRPPASASAGRALPRRVGPVVTGHGLPALAEPGEAGAVEHRLLQRPGVLVAGGPVGRPFGRQRLAPGEDLLDQQPALAEQLAQAAEVGAGVGQAVHVVDAHAGEGAVTEELAGHGVHGVGDHRVLDPHRDEVVDGEEPAHVSARARHHCSV